MPVVFIHGVNTRDTDDNYQSALEARGELLQRLVLNPLAARGGRFADIAIRNAYWGGHGVTFAWNMASLPAVSVLEHLGAEGDGTSLADLQVAATVQQMAGPALDAGGLEALGSTE